MVAIVQKGQMITLVITTDRDFKHRAINFMNNIAFQAEKLQAETFSEAQALIEGNQRVMNVIIDASALTGDINSQFTNIIPLCKRTGLVVLMYLTEKQMSDFKQESTGKSNIIVRPMPFNKADFNAAFHLRGNNSQTSSPFGTDGPVLGSSNGSAPPPQAPQKSLTILEASGHVKETLEHLRALTEDRSNFQALNEIGQRFNGIMGTFAFLSTKVGMTQLKRLSLVIDCLTKTYEDQSQEKISDPHFDLLLNAAKCSYKILMQLRDNPSSLNDELLKQESSIWTAFESSTDIIKRDSKSQSEVDDLLKELGMS